MTDLQLSLYFTEGVSLDTWRSVGMLEREIALYRALVERGVGVHFVTYGGKEDEKITEGLGEIQVLANKWGLPDSMYRRRIQWWPHRGDGVANVFKSNQISGARLAQRAARRAKIPFVARCGYLLSDFEERRQGPYSPEAEAARAVEKEVFSQAECSVVTTHAMRDRIVDAYDLEQEKVRVIPNYVQTELFTPATADKVKSMGRKVLFVGRLDEQKNLFALINALAGTDLELTIVGEGVLKQELVNLVHKTSAKVQFLGNLPNRQLPELMQQHDLFVLPSLYEGHPKALIEAMACGMAVVGSDVAGVREIITHKESGLLCETDAEAIRSALSVLVEDEEMRKQVGKNARQYIEENFSLERVVELELDMLHDVAE